jgi:hypothetical protein
VGPQAVHASGRWRQRPLGVAVLVVIMITSVKMGVLCTDSLIINKGSGDYGVHAVVGPQAVQLALPVGHGVSGSSW